MNVEVNNNNVCENSVNENSVNENSVENNNSPNLKKKSRGRPKLTDEQREKKQIEMKLYQKEYHKINKEKVRESQKKHYENNKESRNKYSSEYHKLRRQKMKEDAILIEKMLSQYNISRTSISIN